MIRRSGIKHEFRVKPVPGLIGINELLEIASFLAGAPRLVIERFKPEMSMDPKVRNVSEFSRLELNQLSNLVSPYFYEVDIS